ncbi:hypothetical protein BD410DRAFT_551841 [Rickenella mellea]|uniref:Uncharacterized protein n=1 Tax=Rickenella mellea TaxID=50990 RepID=A0A4Y7PQE0_9AGAM|nr:hypothetical protein BD410DRAFT_551841 [Rickenella mellea]
MLNLMAYIIDLTLIMDNLFWLLPSNVKGIRFRTPVTSDSVEMAVTAFVDGPAKNDIHDKVLSYVKETRDKYYPTEHVKNAITGLIRTHRFQLHDD